MNRLNKFYWIIILYNSVALCFTVLTLLTAYNCLINYTLGYGFVSFIDMNSINEFWFEFIFLHLVLIGIFILFYFSLKYLSIIETNRKL
jgi:hypothetical protein